MRTRKQIITNLYVKDNDVKRLANGYVVYKRANKHCHALIPHQKSLLTLEARRLQKIAKYEARIAQLKGTIVTKSKSYTKHDSNYWDKQAVAERMRKVREARLARIKNNTNTT